MIEENKTEYLELVCNWRMSREIEEPKLLKARGEEIRVTEENKTEYLELACNWGMSRGIKEQTKTFLKGFNEVVPSIGGE